MLLNWMDQGIRNVKDSPKRMDGVKKLAKDLGGEQILLHDAGGV
jgi:uncharacterized protein with GYD domain